MNTKSITQSLTIRTGIAEVFTVLSDIENWNVWTPSITKISFIGHSRFALGGKVRIIQPKLFPATWTIAELIENKSFTWTTTLFGTSITAAHQLATCGQGTVVEIKMLYEGWLAKLLYRLSFPLTNQYITMEINGLKKVCEKEK